MFTVSVTERQNFKRCRRMWDYGSFNRRSLTRIVSKKSLSLGTLIHQTLEGWLLDSTADPNNLFIKYSVAELNKIKDKYKNQVGSDISDQELEPFLDGVDLGRSMIANYKQFWGSPLPKGFTLVAPEQKVNVEIAQGLVIEGKFDGIIANRNGDLYILEHKTYGQRPRIDNLNVNDQFLAYIWIAQRLGIGNVRGIAYDGMWKRAIPPRGSTMQDLFMRTELRRTNAELKEFEKYLFEEIYHMQTVSEIADTNPSVLYTNHRWEGCFDCQFVPLCNAQSHDEDMEFVIRNFYTIREKDEDDEEA